MYVQARNLIVFVACERKTRVLCSSDRIGGKSGGHCSSLCSRLRLLDVADGERMAQLRRRGSAMAGANGSAPPTCVRLAAAFQECALQQHFKNISGDRLRST